MAVGSIFQDEARIRVAAVGGAILAHAGLLVPLALGGLGLEFERSEDDAVPPTLIILLEAWPARAPQAVLPTSTGAAIDGRPDLRPSPLPARQTKPLPAIPPTSPAPPGAPRMIDARWRVRASVGRLNGSAPSKCCWERGPVSAPNDEWMLSGGGATECGPSASNAGSWRSDCSESRAKSGGRAFLGALRRAVQAL